MLWLYVLLFIVYALVVLSIVQYYIKSIIIRLIVIYQHCIYYSSTVAIHFEWICDEQFYVREHVTIVADLECM